MTVAFYFCFINNYSIISVEFVTSAKNDVDYVLGFMMRNCTIWYGESFDRHKQIKFANSTIASK